MKLKHKTILITGGTTGIGYEMVRRLQADNHVLVVARPSPRLTALTKEFSNITVYASDLSVPDGYKPLAEEISSKHPRLDVLINNAAIQNTPSFIDDDFNVASIAGEINLNFTSICSLTALLLPLMRNHGDDAVIANINSGLALAPKTSSAVYCATKAALDSFSRSLSYQLEDTNINVVQALLPLVDTGMTTGRGRGKLTAAKAAEDILLGIEQGIAINDIGKVKILRILMRLAPSLARKIMKSS